MDIVVTVCFLCMLALVAWTVVNGCKKDRKKRLDYFNNYKKGNFIFIYVISMPLYFMANLHSGATIPTAIFNAFKSGVSLVVMEFDYETVSPLMADNVYFSVAMWTCYVLVILNTTFFAFTLFARKLENALRLMRLKSCKKTYAVVGFNDDNKNIIESVGEGAECVLIADEITDEIKTFSFVHKIAYVKRDAGLKIILKRLFGDFSDKSVEVVINTRDDVLNLVLGKQFDDLIDSEDVTRFLSDGSRGINAYVFADPVNEQTFLSLVSKTDGCLHYVNKYKLVAMDFIDKYPLTRFMTEEELDYSTATVREDVSVNVALIGFGKTNRQIFLTSVANNQFMSYEKRDGDSELVQKPVNYYIYDKQNSKNDKNLNHNYFRCQNELSEGELLPLPFLHGDRPADCKPAREEFLTLDINDDKFYSSLKSNLTAECGKKFNYLVIAFGSDLENLDFAEKICAKLKEWGASSDTRVFVKVRNDDLKSSYEDIAKRDYIVFGNERELVYNVARIVDEKTEAMALDRHICYAIAYNLKSLSDEYLAAVEKKRAEGCSDEELATLKAEYDSRQSSEVAAWKNNAIKEWYGYAQYQREANVYAVLSLRMKLQLMGYDYVEGAEKGVEDAYMSRYQDGDPIQYEQSAPIEGLSVVKYTIDFKHDTMRERMAIQEHQRWMAYMITCGFVPETVENLRRGRYKDSEIRRHGNLTTFDGLIEWRKIKAANTGRSEADCDVIKYDYQLMDNCAELLNKHNYRIIKKK